MFKKDPELRAYAEVIVATPEQQAEKDKCKNSITYFAMKYYNILTSNGEELIPIRNYQYSILNTYQANDKVISVLPRQSGKTVLASIYALWFAMYHDNVTVAITSTKLAAAEEILASIRRAYKKLPLWFQPGLGDPVHWSGSVWAKDGIMFANHSRIIVRPLQSALFRGMTVDLLILDEFAHVNTNLQENFLRSVLPTMCSRKNARILITSTPYGINNAFYNIYESAALRKSLFTAIKLNSMQLDGLNRNNNWIRDQIKEHGEKFVDQEYMCKFIGSTEDAFANTYSEVETADLQSTINDFVDEKTEKTEKSSEDKTNANYIHNLKAEQLKNKIREFLIKADDAKYQVHYAYVPIGQIPADKIRTYVPDVMWRSMPSYMQDALTDLKKYGFNLTYEIDYNVNCGNATVMERFCPIFVRAMVSV